MSDEPSFNFLPWEELPVGVRRNRKKMYNYLVSVLGGDEPGPTPPGPTPTGTGTVTVTCVEENQDPVINVNVFLCDSNQMPTHQDDSNLVAIGYTGADGTATLTLWDKETHQPTEVTDIPFDDYYLFASDEDQLYTYSGALTVDGDETVTITLTEQQEN